MYGPGETDANHPLVDYDAAGNQTKDLMTAPGVVNGARVYDAENRMTIARDINGNQVAAYAYDANGQRVKRSVTGQPEVWQVYGMGGELLAEYAANDAAASPQKEYGYRNGQLLVTADAPARMNVAAAANGGAASASSTLAGYYASATNNGDRKGTNCASGGGWADNTSGAFPDWLQVDFNGSKTIDEVDIFTVQDNYSSPSEPTEAMTFSAYGLTGYDVQYWNGSAWVTVTGGSITSNNKVWRRIAFTAVSTTKIRVLTNAAAGVYSDIAEVEAWGMATATNVAASANGGTASASSTLSGYYASATNNGDRKGTNWTSGGGWADNTSGAFPDWLQLDFNGSKTISEIDVFTVQDNYSSPAEPTEAMTFNTYGLSGYEVQYWNGSAWVTVTGGSIASNNNVWRKISFAPVNTTKMRVLTNAAASVYSDIAEVEAWTGPSSLSAQVHWLVTDQLGTPRMVFDQSGSLATVKRHDYAPFGEELFNGARTTALGYGASDGVRQKFTSKERDGETGLDFFEARYYASTQGRFTSADPIVITGDRLIDPQEINLYNYARNNPLRFTDPTGEDIDDSSLDKNKDYQEWKKAYLSTKAGQAEWDKYNKDHSVTITITMGTSAGGKEGAETTPSFDANGKFTGATIVLGTDFAKGDRLNSSEYPISSSMTENAEHSNYIIDRTTRAVDFFAHEFGHVDDAQRQGRAAWEKDNQLLTQNHALLDKYGNEWTNTPEYKQLQSQCGCSNVSDLSTQREIRAEAAVIPVMRDYYAKGAGHGSMPSRVKQAIQNYEKAHPR